MPEIDVINEKPITMLEMKQKLEEIEKRDKELNFRAKKVKEYLDIFVGKDYKEHNELKKKLIELKISRLKDRHIAKILDIMPKDLDSLKILFSGENITIKQEDLENILKVVKEW